MKSFNLCVSSFLCKIKDGKLGDYMGIVSIGWEVVFAQPLEDNYWLYSEERFSPCSGCVGHVGSQWVCGAECPCQKRRAGLLHVILLFTRPGTVQVIVTIMLCIFLGCDVACRQFKSAVIIHSSCWSCCLLQEGLEAFRAPFLPALQGCSTPSGSPCPRQAFPV